MANSNEQRIRIANEELLAKGNLDVVDETFAAGYVVHAGGKDHHGLDFVRRFVKQQRAAIADLRVVEIAILGEAYDIIVWQRTLREELPHEGSHSTGSLASNSPVTDGEHLFAFFGSRGLYCLDMEGKVLFHTKPRTTPVEAPQPA